MADRAKKWLYAPMKKYVRMSISVSLGALLAWFLFQGTDWRAVYTTIRRVNIGWIALALVFASGTCFARVPRWGYVIRASQPATFRSLFSATQIGFLVNFTVPVRLRELVRAFVLARLAKIPLSQCVVMVALDRINDIFGLLIVIFIALLSFTSDKDIEFAAGVFSTAEPVVVPGTLIRPAATCLTVFVCAILAVLVFLYLKQDFMLRALNFPPEIKKSCLLG